MARRTRLVQSTTDAAPTRVVTVKPHPLARKHALKLAKGDRSRLITQPDGSVLVVRPTE